MPPPPSPQPLLDFSFISPSPPPPPHHHHHHHHLNSAILPPILAGVLVFAFFIVFGVVYRKLSRKRTAPADLKPPQQLQPQQFSYTVLRRATGSFSAANRLGQGGFGSVFKGVLPSGQEIAVKLMDSSGSLQGEREFHNELSLSSRMNITCSPHVASVLGFSSDQNRRRRRRMMLVYEYMQNGSLQDALLSRKCSELIDWRNRFKVLLDIAKGIEFLHFVCDPPIVHSDIKPSNVLLDCDFNAKIADFGLARVLGQDEIVETFIECGEEIGAIDEEEKKRVSGNGEETGSVVEEVESVVTEEVVVNVDHLEVTEGLDRTSVSDRVSVDSGNRRGIGRKKSGGSGRDWWWKQDNGGGESGRVKDYVMEWIGNEIKKERPKKDWITNSSSGEVEDGAKVEQTKQRKKLEKDKKNRKPREWWKEEFCDELVKKKKKKKKRGSISGCSGEMWWQKDEDFVPEKKKRKNKASRSSVDSWLDGFSGEFRIGRRNSQDFASGDIPKSGGISSTPSMRGTVCYIAPEKCDGGQLSEKCDVYSFGVLVLVLVSGRRPLQVTASPMSDFERANLISWARQLARNGRLLDLVDPNIQSLDQEQALLCITIALLCLQRLPGKRPTMREIVGMLSGEAEPPHLPFEFSPSPPSNFPFKSRKKARKIARLTRIHPS